MEMTRVKVSLLKSEFNATLKYDAVEVEGGEVGIKIEGEASWSLQDCTITDSRVGFA